MEKIFVGIIVLFAVLYLYRHIKNSTGSSRGGCGCGCDACSKKTADSDKEK